MYDRQSPFYVSRTSHVPIRYAAVTQYRNANDKTIHTGTIKIANINKEKEVS